MPLNRTQYTDGQKAVSFLSPRKVTSELPRITGVTLTSITAKIYNTLLLNRIEPEIEKIFWKNENDFRRNRSLTSKSLTIHRILEGVRAKDLEATLWFEDFSKAFDSIHRGRMGQIILAYGLPRETVAAIMMLCENTKVKVCSSDRDTDFFDIVTDVLQRRQISTIPVHNLPRLCSSDVDTFNEQKWPRRTYQGCGLRWGHRASGKYIHSSRIPPA